MKEIGNVILKIISQLTNCNLIALRLQDENKNFHFFTSIGFSEEFINKENCIYNNGDYECVCGEIIKGHNENLNSIFTKHGSYFHNEINQEKIDEVKKIIVLRGECVIEGYQSLALIPIKHDNKTIGLIHLADLGKNKFPEEIIKKLESVTYNIVELIIINSTNQEKKILKPKKILLVDDENQLLESMKKLIELLKINSEIILAGDGIEALQKVTQEKISVVITDLNMPNMNGIELIKNIKNRYGIYSPEIIINSGNFNELKNDFIERMQIKLVMEKPYCDFKKLKQILEEA